MVNIIIVAKNEYLCANIAKGVYVYRQTIAYKL